MVGLKERGNWEITLEEYEALYLEYEAGPRTIERLEELLDKYGERCEPKREPLP